MAAPARMRSSDEASAASASSPGVGEGHHIVTGAVHYQEGRGGMWATTTTADLLDIFARPGARLQAVATGAGGVGGRSGLGEETLVSPPRSAKSGQWRNAARRNRRVLAGGAYRQGPAGGETYEPCPLDAGDGPQCAYGRAQVGCHPPSENFPVRQAGTPEVEGDDDGARLAQANCCPRRGRPVCGCRRHHYRPGGPAPLRSPPARRPKARRAVPGVSSAASAAVAAARQGGDPYVWGAAGPARSTARGSSCGPTPRRGYTFLTTAVPSTTTRSTSRCQTSNPVTWSSRADPGEHVAIYIATARSSRRLTPRQRPDRPPTASSYWLAASAERPALPDRH